MFKCIVANSRSNVFECAFHADDVIIADIQVAQSCLSFARTEGATKENERIGECYLIWETKVLAT